MLLRKNIALLGSGDGVHDRNVPKAKYLKEKLDC